MLESSLTVTLLKGSKLSDLALPYFFYLGFDKNEEYASKKWRRSFMKKVQISFLKFSKMFAKAFQERLQKCAQIDGHSIEWRNFIFLWFIKYFVRFFPFWTSKWGTFFKRTIYFIWMILSLFYLYERNWAQDVTLLRREQNHDEPECINF